MMNKNKASKRIIVVAIIFFFLCLCEGIVYYRSLELNIFVQIALNIQNAIKAFAFCSNISIMNAVGSNFEQKALWEQILVYAYIVAVVFAPICTISFIMLSVRKLLYSLMTPFRRKKQHQLVIFSSEDNINALVQNALNESKVTVIGKNALPNNRELQYLEKDVAYFAAATSNERAEVLKKVHINCADVVILFEENPFENLSELRDIIKYLKENPASKMLTCCLVCESSEWSQMIKAYYDKTIEDFPIIRESLDLVMVSLNQIAVRDILRKKPLYEYNFAHSRLNVHAAVLGFGGFGQQFVVDAVNQSVLGSQTDICIDIFDDDEKKFVGNFLKNFSASVLESIEEDVEAAGCKAKYVLRPGRDLDGSLCLRFWNVDIHTLWFDDLLLKLNKENAFTYCIDCFEKDELSVDAFWAMEKCFLAQKVQDVPIVLRSGSDGSLYQFIEENAAYRNIYVEESSDKIMRWENFTHQAENAAAMEFNYRYNQVDIMNSEKWFDEHSVDYDDMLKKWRKMTIFKRESSMALSMHQPVKKAIVEYMGMDFPTQMRRLARYKDTQTFVEQLNGTPDLKELAALEHRRWNYFMILNGYEWGDIKDDVCKANPCILSWDKLCTDLPEYCQYDLMAFLTM